MKGRVMYVDRDVSHLEGIAPILRGHNFMMRQLLDREYGAGNVDSFYDLGEWVFDKFQNKADLGTPYTALITHVPPEHGKVIRGLEGRWAFHAVYERSLGILGELKRMNPGLFILAYTGATSVPRSSMESVFALDGTIDAIVSKSSSAEIDSDFEKIKKALRHVLEVSDISEAADGAKPSAE